MFSDAYDPQMYSGEFSKGVLKKAEEEKDGPLKKLVDKIEVREQELRQQAAITEQLVRKQELNRREIEPLENRYRGIPGGEAGYRILRILEKLVYQLKSVPSGNQDRQIIERTAKDVLYIVEELIANQPPRYVYQQPSWDSFVPEPTKPIKPIPDGRGRHFDFGKNGK